MNSLYSNLGDTDISSIGTTVTGAISTLNTALSDLKFSWHRVIPGSDVDIYSTPESRFIVFCQGTSHEVCAIYSVANGFNLSSTNPFYGINWFKLSISSYDSNHLNDASGTGISLSVVGNNLRIHNGSSLGVGIQLTIMTTFGEAAFI